MSLRSTTKFFVLFRRTSSFPGVKSQFMSTFPAVSVAQCSPATRSARVGFPADAFFIYVACWNKFLFLHFVNVFMKTAQVTKHWSQKNITTWLVANN